MATAVSDAIENAYFQSLQSISAGATYENTPSKVERWSENGNTTTKRALIFLAESPQPNADGPMLQDSWLMRCKAWYCVGKETSSKDRKTLEATLVADLLRWLHANYTAGSRVRNFLNLSVADALVHDVPAKLVQWDAWFLTTLNNPFAQG